MTGRPTLTYDPHQGLYLTWHPQQGLALDAVPVRVRIAGSTLFRVWGWQDSGEAPPRWADADFAVSIFGGTDKGPEELVRLDTVQGSDGSFGWRAVARRPRVEVALELRCVAGELEFGLSVRNPQGHGGQALPLAQLTLSIGELTAGREGR